MRGFALQFLKRGSEMLSDNLKMEEEEEEEGKAPPFIKQCQGLMYRAFVMGAF